MSVMASNSNDKLLRAFKIKLTVFPGFQVAANNFCLLYNGDQNAQGYSKVSYRTPLTGHSTSSNIQRIAVMVRQGTLDLDPRLDASHLCHNPLCINVDHIHLEPRKVNCQRRRCVSEGQCLGHEGHPECLLHLSMHSTCLIF